MLDRLSLRGKVVLGAVVHTVVLAAAFSAFSRPESTALFGVGFTIALAVSVAVAALGAHVLTRPIRELTDAALAMSSGDLSVRAPTVGGRDLAKLGHTLNRFARALSGSLDDLRTERDRLASILDGMGEGVLVLDAEGRVLLANPALSAMTLVGADAVGKSAVEALRNASLQDALTRAQRSADDGEGAMSEIEIGGGLPKRLLVRVSRLAGPSGEGGLIAVFHDVTELRRLETVRTDFVANVSHELRTPVASISTAAETLLTSGLVASAEAAEFVEIIDRNALRLRQLVEDLLDLAKLESKSLRLHLVDVDAPAVVAHAIRLIADQASRRGVTVRSESDASLPRARADRRALEQVVFNLLDNAVKYSGEGAAITVRATSQGAQVVLAIEDTGVGIPAQHLGRIFERFYRVDAGRSRELGGTGLGLAIVKHLVESMAGHVEVESVQGQGTTFRVYLPAAAASA